MLAAGQDGGVRHVRTAPQPRGRVGDQRPAGVGRQIGEGGDPVFAEVHGAGDEQAAVRVGQWGWWRPAGGRRAGQQVGRRRIVVRGLEGLAQRPVHVHRPGCRAGRRGEQRHGQRGRGLRWFLAGNGRLHVAAHVRAVQVLLVDGLGSATALELGWPVGGEDEQWHARVEGLDHGGEVVGGRRARRAHQRHRAPRGPGQAEGEEAARPLVEVDRHVQSDRAVGGDRQWRRPRTRRDRHVGDAPGDQLGEEGPQRRLRGDRVGGRRVHDPPEAASTGPSMARSLTSVSSSSRSGSLPPTTPAPA